jgi:hypothetical protein
MTDEWVRMGILFGSVIVMFFILKAPKKTKNDSEEKDIGKKG